MIDELKFFTELEREKTSFNYYEFFMLQNQLATFFFLYRTFLENNIKSDKKQNNDKGDIKQSVV